MLIWAWCHLELWETFGPFYMMLAGGIGTVFITALFNLFVSAVFVSPFSGLVALRPLFILGGAVN